MSASVRAGRVLVQALAALGVRHVVLAPGSRSAPLAYALAEAARPPSDTARDPHAPHLRLHVRVDERSAGFLALGIARAARAAGRVEPVAVVTTSGTAVANLHPAALEAHHAGLPLLLLTADRPHELRGTGANQTTEQVGLLGPGLRLEVDVPAPTGRSEEDRDLRRVAARVVAAATGARTRHPGPVHVNLAFRDPLVPDGEPWPESSRAGLTEVVPRDGGGVTGLERGAAASAGAADRTVAGEPPTVVVAGDAAGQVAREVAEANGWPLLAEPSSGARGGPCAVPAYRLLLGDPRLGGAVRRAIVLGRPTLSRPVQSLLARPGVDVVVIAPEGPDWPDAARNASEVLPEVPQALLRGGPGAEASAAGWLDTWVRAGRAALAAVREESRGDRADALTGPQVADAVALAAEGHVGAPAAAPAAAGPSARPEADPPAGAGTDPSARPEPDPSARPGPEPSARPGPDPSAGPEPHPSATRPVLAVGSSNPVRDLDLVADWHEPPPVLANRGLAGIDGTLSTAAGTALGSGRPVRALVGDLTFLHDLGGLLVGPLEEEPDLQVVVANDDGGSIFALLEHGEPEREAVFERVFGTPHGADLGALCAGYGVPHRLVRTTEELAEVLAAPVRGRSVVEVVVDRTGRRALAARTAAAVTRAVDRALGETVRDRAAGDV